MFERLIALFGQDRFTKLEKARVLVVGLGGVGGYALEALVRSGVKNITIVDGDVVEESNLNRQIISNNKNIGISKCEAAAERALSINKNANISIIYKFITEDNFNDLLVNNSVMFIKVLLLIFKVLINDMHNLMFCSFRWMYLSLVRLFAISLNNCCFSDCFLNLFLNSLISSLVNTLR